jgi:hypothetical protein
MKDPNKIQIKPGFERSPVNKKDWTAYVKVQIPIEKVKDFFKKLFKKK